MSPLTRLTSAAVFAVVALSSVGLAAPAQADDINAGPKSSLQLLISKASAFDFSALSTAGERSDDDAARNNLVSDAKSALAACNDPATSIQCPLMVLGVGEKYQNVLPRLEADNKPEYERLRDGYDGEFTNSPLSIG